MTIILFIVILAVLVFVHELGHFLLAKLFGIRVDEFALGFPPRIFSIKYGETNYSINLIPFGGYVKIFGEEAADVASDSPDWKKSFIAKNRAKQALVLAGGILMNVAFAWVLLSLVFMTGTPVSTHEYVESKLQNVRLMVIDVLPLSPADVSGIKPGDIIVGQGNDSVEAPTVESVQNYISANEGKEITLRVTRNSEEMSFTAVPKTGVLSNSAGIGISMERVGTLKLPLIQALYEGGVRTGKLFVTIAKLIAIFFYDIFTFGADFSQVAGPVGIAVMVDEISTLGWFYLVYFTALISLNLAVINLVPFPALDGGRLLFVLIESVIRKPLNPKFTRALNTAGFILLLCLLVLVTFKDISKLI